MIEPLKGNLPGAMPASGARARRDRAGRRGAVQRGRLTSVPSHYAYLFVFGVLGLIAYYGLVDPNHASLLTRFLAALVLLTSCLPMALFLFRAKIFQIPALEAHCLFYALSFGFAGFLPVSIQGGAGSITESDFDLALLVTLAGLGALLGGYYVVGSSLMKKVRPLQIDRGFTPATLESLAWVGCVSAAIISAIGRHIELNLVAQVSDFTYSLGFYLLLVLALEKRILGFSRLGVFCLLLPYEIFFNSGLSGGQLAGVVGLVCWVSLVILRCWRHIPVYLLAGAFLFFIIFQPVKFYVRDLAWNQGVQLGPVEMIKAYGEGFLETYGSSSAMMANRKANFDDSFDRVNHLILLAAIIRDTPSSQPYMHGETYVPLLTKWIPRLVWPGKPQETLGNTWAVRYGFLAENDSTTSFNLPWLPEMYMNGGWVAVIVVMFTLGMLYRFLWLRLMSVTSGVAAYAVGIVFAQSLVFAESNLSMQLGGVIIFAIVLWVLIKFLGLVGLYSPAVPPRSPSRGRAVPARS
jgi:hypothetical protein